jgi:ribosomal protein S18 acetylase RimI-like enzyme
MDNALIRGARVEDLDGVLELWRAADAAPTVTDSHEGLERLLASDPGALILAERDGVTIGSLIAAWDGWRGSFYRLAVHPSHRREGIASALLEEGELRLERLGACRLTAIVIDDELVAMSFWRAAGYTQQQRRARFVRHIELRGEATFNAV